MATMRPIALLLGFALAAFAVENCLCNPANPETLKERVCSLCNEAEKQPGDVRVFFLKDINPRKPNRWLALPRAHSEGPHNIEDLSPAERTELWTAAIAKARELWGDEWGIAYNGVKVRTQCHFHIHIGKLLQGIETNRKVVVRHPSQIPVKAGEGVWIHPAGKMLHVHLGEQITETALLR